jgi:hypothetical protein
MRGLVLIGRRAGAGLVALAMAAAPPAFGAPAITGVSGDLKHGGSLTIRGNGFGARGDFHPDPDKLIRVFDDFNDGDLKGNPYLTWIVFNESRGPLSYRTESSRTGSPRDGYARRHNTDLGSLMLKAGNRREYYSSFYMRLSNGFDISSMGSGTHQFKIVRLYSTNPSEVNLYPAIGASDGFHMVAEFVEPPVMRYQLQLERIPSRPAGWHKMAVYYKKSSARNANDGQCRIWWDNKLVFDWLPHFQNPGNNPPTAPGYPITGDFDTDGKDLAGDWAVGNYFSSASGQTWADFDDVYLDHSQARVELGNAPMFSECSFMETQVPVSWSDGSVRVAVNTGAFPSGARAYVYVVDGQGRANAQGFPVALGTSNFVASVPTVQITGPTSELTYAVPAGQETIDLTGKVLDAPSVSRVMWRTQRGHSGTASGATAWRASGVPLSRGPNVIVVEAVTSDGTQGSAYIRVVRGEDTSDRLKPKQKFVAPDRSGDVGRLVFGEGAVEVEIHDFRGEVVYQAKKNGPLNISWDGKDNSGGTVPSGVYICKITADTGETVYHSVSVVK